MSSLKLAAIDFATGTALAYGTYVAIGALVWDPDRERKELGLRRGEDPEPPTVVGALVAPIIGAVYAGAKFVRRQADAVTLAS